MRSDAALSSILAMAVCWDDAGSPIEMPFVENEVAAAPWPASSQAQGSSEPGVVGHLCQMLLPMVAGIATTTAKLTSWLHAQGLEALNALLLGEAQAVTSEFCPGAHILFLCLVVDVKCCGYIFNCQA